MESLANRFTNTLPGMCVPCGPPESEVLGTDSRFVSAGILAAFFPILAFWRFGLHRFDGKRPTLGLALRDSDCICASPTL